MQRCFDIILSFNIDLDLIAYRLQPGLKHHWFKYARVVSYDQVELPVEQIISTTIRYNNFACARVKFSKSLLVKIVLKYL